MKKMNIAIWINSIYRHVNNCKYKFWGYQVYWKSRELSSQMMNAYSKKMFETRVEDIASLILWRTINEKIRNPNYNIEFWDGPYTQKNYYNFTQKPSKDNSRKLKKGLIGLFEEFGHIKELTKERDYLGTYKIVCKSKIREFYGSLMGWNEIFTDFYCGLRSVDKDKAIGLIRKLGIETETFYKLETEFLHRLELKRNK